MSTGRRCAAFNSGVMGFIPTFLTVILLILAPRSFAVITMGATGRNTSAPTGALANSGWQFEGLVGSFTGTAISSNSFLTAQHIGDMLGASFVFDGQSYPIVAQTADPYSDLVVYTIAGTLPTYAPLYSSADDADGKAIVIYGRGVDRGAAVTVNGQLKGWQWGSGDGSLSWGTNTIAGSYGSMYGWQFSNDGDSNQGQVGAGDSGGGVFVNNGGVWELAGVVNSVQDQFSLDGTDATSMDAALFDTSGLYAAWGSAWSQVGTASGPQPTWGYATSVAGHATFIEAAVDATNVPEPGIGALTLAGASVRLLARRRLRS